MIEFAVEHYPAFLSAVSQASRWHLGGEPSSIREEVADRLENAPSAFHRMLQGKNFGKALVRLQVDP